ncbi:MAG TPA: sigma-E processing peptidase SpoIIGA [Candidatus Onthousia faecipullorum]|uniref:Sigma-E processing peptidase SpoIIGA n=1 Tax=Candidatus Onthousia faecipullorum TaxID=2840887 RepID=A0A9D1GBX6_9FIRM|nr:sigma-E processing peptidase SpoIIGA [Candidatus Onthousia faecipullorum]
MKVYLDLIFFINFMFDLLLLMTVSIECKVFSKKRRLLISSFLGSLSTFLLFLPLNNFSLFLFKVVISIIMIFVGFKISSKELFFSLIKSLYGNSIILGGLIYFLNNQFSYKQKGFIFIHDGTSLNLIIILISSPIIFYLYHKTMTDEKKKRDLLHKVSIKCKRGTITTLGFLDTGNNIKDPYKKRGVILINSSEINLSLEESILVPFKTVESNSLLRCIEIEELRIDDNLIKKKYLLGVSPKNIEIKGASCILPNIIEEELK